MVPAQCGRRTNQLLLGCSDKFVQGEFVDLYRTQVCLRAGWVGGHIAREVKETSIPVITLEQVVEEKVGKKIDLMKLDCEGAEYEILLNQDPKVFKKINRIIMEYHDLDEKRNFSVLTKYFEELGYYVKRYDNRVHKNLGYLFADRVSRIASR